MKINIPDDILREVDAWIAEQDKATEDRLPAKYTRAEAIRMLLSRGYTIHAVWDWVRRMRITLDEFPR